MRRTILTWLVNSQNSRNSRLETMEASTPSCVRTWRHFWPSISVCSFLCWGDAHAKSWVGLHQEHASEDGGRGPRRRFPGFLCLLSGRRWRGDLGAGQGSWRWGFAAKAGWKGQLVKETGFAKVQKQKEYQRKTLDEKGGLTSQSRETVYSRSRGEKISADKEESRLQADTQNVKNKNINIIYSPYFPLLVLPQICICQRFPFVFAGKHNLILE